MILEDLSIKRIMYTLLVNRVKDLQYGFRDLLEIFLESKQIHTITYLHLRGSTWHSHMHRVGMQHMLDCIILHSLGQLQMPIHCFNKHKHWGELLELLVLRQGFISSHNVLN
jgi:hypothetical protein